MRNWKPILLICLLLSCSPGHATNVSTADPNYPQTYDDIDSEPLREQFRKLINDVDNLWAAIAPNFLEANQLLGALVSGKAQTLPLPSCFNQTNALTWRPGIGFGCNDLEGLGGGTDLGPAFPFTVLAGPSSNGPSATATFRFLTSNDLPLPTSSSIGGVQSASPAAHLFMSGISTSGVPLFATPAFTDVSGILSPSQLPTPSPSSMGGTQSIAVIPHNFLTGISTSGVPTQAQASFPDVSGNISVSQMGSGAGASSATCWHGDGTWAQCGGGSSGGGGAVVGLTFNSTAAAAANTALIQAALNGEGHIAIDCPSSSILYINSTLLTHSNSYLYISPSCTITGTAGTSAILTNYASTTSWTTIWDSSGSITTGPLSVIRLSDVRFGWGTSQTFAKGQYTAANGNIYWESVTSCTTASSGTGPTGTGSGIGDGTCSWNYVTTYFQTSFYFNNSLLLLTIHWPNHGMVVGNQIWIRPKPDGGTGQSYWSGSGSAGQLGGMADSAYFGIFPVIFVNDSNYITVVIRRPAASAFSGIPMDIKQADDRIHILDGGMLNYNYLTNTCNGSYTCNAVNFAGVHNLIIDEMHIEFADNYAMELGGVSLASLKNIQVGPTRTDGLKIFGPAYDLSIDGFSGMSAIPSINRADDFMTMQTQPPQGFTGLSYAAGDIIGVRLNNIIADNGKIVGIWTSTPNLYIDNIDVAGSAASGGGTNNDFVIQPDPPNGAANIGTIDVHNFTLRNANGISVTSPNVTIQQLNIHDVDISPNNAGNTLLGISNGTIKQVNMYNTTGQLNFSYFFLSGGTVGNLNIYNNEFDCWSANNGTMISGSGGSLTNINAHDNYVTGTCNYFIDDKWGVNGSFVNNSMPNDTRGPIEEEGSSSSWYLANDYMPVSTFGALRFSTTGQSTSVTSGGGNNFNNTWFTNILSGDNYTPYGFDIRCDVTKASRTTGAYCYNTNASAGTITAAGPVMDQGTSANSWFLIANPTGQQF